MFEEIKDLDPDKISRKLYELGFRRNSNDSINRNCIIAQYIKSKSGRDVVAGPTTFAFLDEKNDQDEANGLVLRYLPENIMKFSQNDFANYYNIFFEK